MSRITHMLVVLVTLLSGATTQSLSPGHKGFHATFAASNGAVIKLDTRTGTLETPRSRSTHLLDCSDKFQVCMTDHRGFAFSFFRHCDGGVLTGYRRLRFHPRVLAALGNNYVWLVFDSAPNYLFEYAYSKGIIGIYIGPAPSFDFRSLLRDRNFQVSSLDGLEYHIAGSEGVAGCSR